MKKRAKLGIIANEFFDPTISRIGGFGMLSRQISRCAESLVDFPLSVQLFHGAPPPGATLPRRVYGRPLHRPRGNWRGEKYTLLFSGARPDVWLSVDYRPNYEYFLLMFQSAPLIMWVQDPKTPEDWERISTCRVPGSEYAEPQGLGFIDCTPLSKLVESRIALGARTIFSVPSSFLIQKIESTYNVAPESVATLCYPMEPLPRSYSKAETPVVTFLGRLDPQKRPWIAAEIAARMPDVRFQFMGKSHFSGPGSWSPQGLPPNIEVLGHLDGRVKAERLGASWIMLNTSIHEGLPISFVEGLQNQAPIVSCVDPEGVVSRFGHYVGEFRGGGMESVPAFVSALRSLIESDAKRLAAGQAGQRWAAENHSQSKFASQLSSLLMGLG